MTPPRRALATLALAALAAAGCGDGGSASTTGPERLTTSIAPDSDAAALEGAVESTTTAAAVDGSAATTAPGRDDEPATTAAEPADVTFTTADGLTLEGRVFPGGGTWVVLAHMRPADQTSFFEFADHLREQGFTALTYNNRGYGGSDPAAGALDVSADARAAIAYARSQGAQRVFFVGASMNGAAALQMGAEEDLAGIVTLSGVPSWDNTPGIEVAGDITEPALFVAAADDGNAVADARSFASATGGPSTVVEYETGGHGTAMFSNEDLSGRIVEFIGAGS